MKIGLGKLIEIDFQFWRRSNDFYSDEIWSTSVDQGFKHAKKAGLIGKYKENLHSNLDLIKLIEEKKNYTTHNAFKWF